MSDESEIYRHAKTGGHYKIVARGTIEATMTPCIVYQSLQDARVWVRPESEFMDGRFQKSQWPRTKKTPVDVRELVAKL